MMRFEENRTVRACTSTPRRRLPRRAKDNHHQPERASSTCDTKIHGESASAGSTNSLSISIIEENAVFLKANLLIEDKPAVHNKTKGASVAVTAMDG
jgi:hypothetical protein